MSKIRILPENLANQIAAGEVVERPASVVKEFVENSIDAGAGRIIVQVEGGGSRLIRVIDDGEGMDQDDMLLCLERHATSKLQDAEQLAAIRTLGFRGEAIPSISSVSRMTITSRTAGASLGYQAEVRFGVLRKVHEMGCSRGTIMEVRDLFGNVPARRKFLKTVRTELSHIEEIIVNSALAFPSLGITYTVNGRDVWSFAPGGESLAGRVKKVMGRHVKGPLIKLDSQLGELGLRGYLLPPDDSGGTSSRLRIFVNNRPVRDRMVSHGVTEGLHGFLMKGRRPAGALFLDLDPESVDVNVHPTKQEIRFHQSQRVHQLVVMTVKKAMGSYQHGLQYAVFGKPSDPVSPSDDTAAPVAEKVSSWQPVRPSPPQVEEPSPLLTERPGSIPAAPLEVFEKKELAAAEQPESSPAPVQNSSPFRFEVSPLQKSKSRFTYVGQFMKSYIVCESDEGIAVIDQHAAHERLLFERMKKEYNAMQLPGQALLFPEIVECTPDQVEVLKNHGKEIARLGIIIEEFGGESYAIKAVPAILAHLGPLEIINGIFDHYLGLPGKGKGAATRVDDILAVMACKAAVKAHDALLPEEGEALLRSMEKADVFSHCPHGRPVLKIFSEAEIKKWFHR